MVHVHQKAPPWANQVSRQLETLLSVRTSGFKYFVVNSTGLEVPAVATFFILPLDFYVSVPDKKYIVIGLGD